MDRIASGGGSSSLVGVAWFVGLLEWRQVGTVRDRYKLPELVIWYGAVRQRNPPGTCISNFITWAGMIEVTWNHFSVDGGVAEGNSADEDIAEGTNDSTLTQWATLLDDMSTATCIYRGAQGTRIYTSIQLDNLLFQFYLPMRHFLSLNWNTVTVGRYSENRDANKLSNHLGHSRRLTNRS
jgi:hypothetical protein